MFRDYLEVFIKKYNIKIDTVHNRYISIKDKDGNSIRIWYDGRVFYKDKKIKFNEKKIKKWLNLK